MPAMLHSWDKQKDCVTAGVSSVAECQWPRGAAQTNQISTTRHTVIPSEADDGIKVYRIGVESVAEQVETALLRLQKLTNRQMQNL
ncbi:hypothetical protein PsorP6_002118 [Peronosclerospora sorghi]|uniref:Uncharacterized protein n=1 Tax=Peronosclerospora sorghi TaxID=230839 RepID=A0ACC0WUP3_9STRA|nr:hypothetical protein PsorP6_002118 [Peronosclerospora sorghi]